MSTNNIVVLVKTIVNSTETPSEKVERTNLSNTYITYIVIFNLILSRNYMMGPFQEESEDPVPLDESDDPEDPSPLDESSSLLSPFSSSSSLLSSLSLSCEFESPP